jgi:hypothetical protein
MGNTRSRDPIAIEMKILVSGQDNLYVSSDSVKVGSDVIIKITSKLSSGYLIYTFSNNVTARLYAHHDNYLRLRTQLVIGKAIAIKYIRHDDYHEIIDILPLPQYTLDGIILDFLPIIVEGTLGENTNKSYRELILTNRSKWNKITLYIPTDQVDNDLKGKRCTLTFSMIGSPHVYGVTSIKLILD